MHCRKSAAERCRQMACGNRGRQSSRSPVSLPFSEVKCIAPDLDEVTALQSPVPRRLSRNRNRTERVEEGLGAAEFHAGMLRLHRWILEEVDVGLLGCCRSL